MLPPQVSPQVRGASPISPEILLSSAQMKLKLNKHLLTAFQAIQLQRQEMKENNFSLLKPKLNIQVPLSVYVGD